MNLLLTGSFNYSDKQINEIKNLGYNVEFEKDETAKLSRDLSKFEVIVCNGLFLKNDINNFKNLKAVQLTSSGVERFPLDKIDTEKIIVANAKGVYSIPIAEWVILKILEMYKDSKTFILNQQNKKWEKKREVLELHDKRACIIGAGDIGTEIAKRLNAFGVEVIGIATSKKNREFFENMFTLNEIKKAVINCDLIISTISLNDYTKNLINRELFKYFKRSSILVNVSRGEVVNEKDLIQALKKGTIAGAILDVFEKEPLDKENELWDMNNVIITPHNSFASCENKERLYELIFSNLKAIKDNKEIKNQVNKRVE